MEKKNFVSLIMRTVGGILFAIGMCMCLLPQWNAFNQGVVISVIGALILLVMLLVRRKMEGKSIIVKLSARTIGTVLLGIVGALTLGIGIFIGCACGATLISILLALGFLCCGCFLLRKK